MREISTEKIKIGEHVLIDGVEYVVKEADPDIPCEGCAFDDGSKPCSSFIECDGIVYVKVKKEPKYRPYKDTDEMIADWKERFNARDCPSYSMPLIWIWDKDKVEKMFVTGFRKQEVNTADALISMESLFECYTYLDGSPCGKGASE